MSAISSFSWFSGLMTLEEPCPPALFKRNGLLAFFESPNDSCYGSKAPRRLIHECLHSFQLAGSSWLQRLVAEEWSRVLAFERTGVAPPFGPLHRVYGRSTVDVDFSVHNLVECLARFWDMLIRTPGRVLEEENYPDTDGYFKKLRNERVEKGNRLFISDEYDAVMQNAATFGNDPYPKPYLWIKWAALNSPAVNSYPQNDPVRVNRRASWATNILLPIVGYLALNTEDPVRAFVICMDAVLSNKDGLHLETFEANAKENIIYSDQLMCWLQLYEPLTNCLAASNLHVKPIFGESMGEGLREHPVWCHLPQRYDALNKMLDIALKLGSSANQSIQETEDFTTRVVPIMYLLIKHGPPPVFGLMGLCEFRKMLSTAFIPPVLRFADTQLSAVDVLENFIPWDISNKDLTTTVEETQSRYKALCYADTVAKFNKQASAAE